MIKYLGNFTINNTLNLSLTINSKTEIKHL